ncbi:MAG: hypothetical protein PHW55_11345, partial [Methanothrix sp.]|nr:hypothetical protein [Methanothrix sp.]
IGSAIPRSKGGEQRPPVEIDYEKSLYPGPQRIPLSLRADNTLAAVPPPSGRGGRRGRKGRWAPTAPGAPSTPRPPPGGIRPGRGPSTAGAVHGAGGARRSSGRSRRWGGVEAVRGCPSPPGPTTPSPRSRLHPVEADVEGGKAGGLPRRRRRRKAEPPSSSRPRHKCARSRSSAVGVGAILARRLIKG